MTDGARRARPRELVLAALIAVIACAPFLDKAVQQDDWAYIATAPALLDAPEDWLEQETIYQGERVTAAEGVLHGPVWLTLLALGLEASDGGVFVPHVIMAALLTLLAVSTASLAARFGAPPLATAVALATSPGMLVMAGSVMTDLPMVALFVASLALCARALERDSVAELVLAGFLGLAASLTRYHGAAVVPMLAVAPLLLSTAGSRVRGLVAAGVAAAGFVLFAVWTRGDWERAVDMLGEIPVIDRRTCFLALVCALGGCGAGWIAAVLAAPRRTFAALAGERARGVLWGIGALLGLLCSVLARSAPSPPGVNAALQTVFFVAGGVGLAVALRPFVALAAVVRGRGARSAEAPGHAWRERFGPDAWLALWLVGYAFAAWYTVPFGATRYALPALPPLFLIAGRFVGRRLPRRSAVLAAVVSCVLGLLAATADYRSAEVHRGWARDVAARREMAGPDDFSQGELWVWGELGFRYYLERVAGARILPSDSNEPAPGDHLLKSSICTATPDDGLTGLYAIDPRLYERIESESLRDARDAFPVRIHNAAAGAGFYHGDAGFLPFAFSTAVHDHLQVWSVNAPNPFFALYQAGVAVADASVRVRVSRFGVHPDRPMRMALNLLGAGGVTFPSVPVPAGNPTFRVAVGESQRVWAENAPGRGALVRILVDGEVRAERSIESRVLEADRAWFPLSVDLSDRAGDEVALRFEVQVLAGTGGESGAESGLVFTGFAMPRIVTPRE